MYEKLRQAVDDVGIVDNHGHPGLLLVNEKMPIAPKDQIPFTDKFLPPVVYCKDKPPLHLFQHPFVEDLHYEIYEKHYSFSRDDLQNPDKYPSLAAVYEERRHNVAAEFPKFMEEAHVDYMMANIFMPDELEGIENITLVPAVDGLMYPFECEYLYTREFSRQYLLQFRWALGEWEKEYKLPEDFSFSEYMAFIDRFMEDLKARGAVAIKFAIAYIRNMHCENQDHRNPEELFLNAKNGDTEEYTHLQDYIFWYILRKCLTLDLPVQIHTAVTDNYPEYFSPKNLANILRDDELYKLKLVVLHAAFPCFNDAVEFAMSGKLLKPNNIYIDFSGRFMFRYHPRIIADVLKMFWIHPNLWGKTLYGSDVLLGDRYVYTAAKAGREAAYLALSDMIDAGIVTEETAVVIAKDFLRNNAIRLYKLALPVE